MNDVGYTTPACACTYWVGAAMGLTDYKDLRKPHKETAQATKLLAANAAHLAACLKAKAYPGV